MNTESLLREAQWPARLLDSAPRLSAILVAMIYVTLGTIFSRTSITSIIGRTWGEVRLVTG